MTRLNRQYHETSDRLETLLKSTTGKNLLIPQQATTSRSS